MTEQLRIAQQNLIIVNLLTSYIYILIYIYIYIYIYNLNFKLLKRKIIHKIPLYIPTSNANQNHSFLFNFPRD